MRLAIFVMGLLLTGCGQPAASRPNAVVPPLEPIQASSAQPAAAAAAASSGIDGTAKQLSVKQAPPNVNILTPPPLGERSPDESPTNVYHVSQAQADAFENPHNVKMTVARQFVWDQWKLAWWVQHHQEDGVYIKAHRLLFDRVKVRFSEAYRMKPHLTGTNVMQMRAVAYEFPIPEVRDENGIVLNNGLRADPLSHVEGDAPGAEDWYQQKAATRLPSSWRTQMDFPERWNKVWDNPTRLDIIPKDWFSQFIATLDQPVWQTVWDSQPPRSPPPNR